MVRLSTDTNQTTPMNDKTTAAAILAKFRFDPWNLSGPHNKEIRRQLLTAITGEKRSLAKCGVTEISKELRARIDASAATCAARYPDAFRAYFAA
jgi:hypothetical protein